MQKLTVVVLAAFVGICTAYGRNGDYGFPLESTLECFGVNRYYGYPGQPRAKVEDIPVIAFQPARSGEVYLPVESP